MTINFARFIPLYFVISAIFIIPGIYSLINYGLRPAIDFTGGSLLEVDIEVDPQPTDSEIINSLTDIIEISSIQRTSNSFIIRTKPLTQDLNQLIQTTLTDQFGPVTEIQFESVGPTLGQELLRKTVFAIILAAVAILIYVAYQFKELKYGVSAIVAMFHDTLIVTGVFSLLGHFFPVEVDTLFVTAILTILSFSVHDTIVVYDRIRETLRRHSQASFEQIVNKAIAETLTRSVNNSMTIIFMLSALYLLGGTSIKWFVFALLIGTITGTYSSTFTATPLLVVWERLAKKKRQ